MTGVEKRKNCVGFNVIAAAMSMCVAVGNKVVDSPAWHSLLGVPLKNDVESGGVKKQKAGINPPRL